MPDKICAICGGKRYYAKGLCSVCYQREFRRKRRWERKKKHSGVEPLRGEIWRDIIGYEGRYQVSNFGRVKSLTRDVQYTNGTTHTYWEKALRLQMDKDGYFSVALCKDGIMKGYRVHRLVAEAFISLPPKTKTIINHKNGDKGDNRVENLEWTDAEGNQRHRVYSLEKIPRFGIRPIKCVETGETFPSVMEAARAIGSHSSNLVQVLNHHPRHHTVKGLHWEYI